MENKMITIEQAYKAMFYFLEHEYELTKSDDIGCLLGSMDWTIWDDSSSPADPAMWEDWLIAVKRTL
ncbi:hypothetical protein LGZ99_23995 [Photorhabdus temperata]|uniref:Uncharacterized protein n=1 Tax=Photorhabdus temperata subsp. temperata Meg1 TaxID=1393735 RepID=A0A081RQJ5_PHOTE|nr:hypothetical protein [Photorhabdus temperata]KER00948.1 hypothetical protein MEG1DRAFT_04458 [Photorhabdus temperata subsp. temperata Meg1]MCT8350171.1 hypothetical protein [Photorhabdus temperata]